MIIDGNNLILGRLASFAAKKLLLGESVEVVNCEEAVITGTKETILTRFKEKMNRTHPFKGPFFIRSADGIVKRTIRGMLPFGQSRGREAFKRVMCYNSIPEEFKNRKLETIKEANLEKLPDRRYIRIKEICRYLGAKL